MDLKQIHELIKIVNKSNIGEISIEDKDGKVTIKQKEEQLITVGASAAQQVYNVAPPSTQVAAAAPQASSEAPAPKADNLITIKSPMIGTFIENLLQTNLLLLK
jgi:acetyl-CoA carboxylase biotin carboxyl carrier protein